MIATKGNKTVWCIEGWSLISRNFVSQAAQIRKQTIILCISIRLNHQKRVGVRLEENSVSKCLTPVGNLLTTIWSKHLIEC